MSSTIHFSVHRNPVKDADGNDTYQVRQETHYTAHKNDLMAHLKLHHSIRPELMEMALTVLQDEIVEFITENKRLHIDGLGTFYLKLGFRKQFDEEGNELKTRFTDPKEITGNQVCVETIGFTPDKSFLSLLDNHGYSFVNRNGRGNVGHSAHYTREQIERRLAQFFGHNDHITCKQMEQEFGLTHYMARKWLDLLTVSPKPFLHAEQIGRLVLYKPFPNS